MGDEVPEIAAIDYPTMPSTASPKFGAHLPNVPPYGLVHVSVGVPEVQDHTLRWRETL